MPKMTIESAEKMVTFAPIKKKCKNENQKKGDNVKIYRINRELKRGGLY